MACGLCSGQETVKVLALRWTLFFKSECLGLVPVSTLGLEALALSRIFHPFLSLPLTHVTGQTRAAWPKSQGKA